jgi:DNA polymerase III delta prime subunit
VYQRIILTGASGVGKTSLARALAPELFLEVIPELGRELCQAMGYKRIGDIPDQEAFKRRVLDEQIKLEDAMTSFISDRSTIDLWVLWQRWNICTAMTYDTEGFYELARRQSEKYSHIIYIPPMFAPEEDGFRWTDADYQRQIDRIIRSTLYEWGLLERTYTVKTEGIDNRVDEIRQWLGKD